MRKDLNEPESLESRIRQIAANMEGCYFELDGVAIPHSIFVEWDQTWDVVEDEDLTNKDLEELIKHQEFTHDEYYNEEIDLYVAEQKNKTYKLTAYEARCASELANAVFDEYCLLFSRPLSHFKEIARYIIKDEAENHTWRKPIGYKKIIPLRPSSGFFVKHYNFLEDKGKTISSIMIDALNTTYHDYVWTLKDKEEARKAERIADEDGPRHG